MGPSGSGKTTLLGALAGQMPYSPAIHLQVWWGRRGGRGGGVSWGGRQAGRALGKESTQP